MISETYWTILENANRELAQRFARLREARASGNQKRIQNAEMDYFQALQRLFDDVQNAVSEQSF
jgi:F0F1-type ATP synthase membrane subunit b/b'